VSEQYAELAAFLRGLAVGRGGELTDAARATCQLWADVLTADAADPLADADPLGRGEH